jgi:SAM-dependent methyltransferase
MENNNLVVWEKEYKEKKLMSGDKPQKSFLKFLKFLKKESKKEREGGVFMGGNLTNTQKTVLDLGSGNGKNSVFLAKKGYGVFGLEFSKNAIDLAQDLKSKNIGEIKIFGGEVSFWQKSIGEKFDFSDDSFDIILDITSSNSLNKKERETFLQESQRVLKKDGYFFARGLLKDGDTNAKLLLKKYSTEEKNTYKIPEFGLTERVFEKKELEGLYGKYFKILNFEKETHYTTYGSNKYKRNFWVLYMKKK